MGAMNFSRRDLYPNIFMDETSLEVNPEAEDREALAEDTTDEAKKLSHNARGKTLVIAAVILIALVVFLGID